MLNIFAFDSIIRFKSSGVHSGANQAKAYAIISIAQSTSVNNENFSQNFVFSPVNDPIHYLDKYLYLSPLLWSKITLIVNCVGGVGADPSFYR